MATDAISGMLAQQGQKMQSNNRLDQMAPLPPVSRPEGETTPQQVNSLSSPKATEGEKESKSMTQIVEELNVSTQYQKRAIQFSLDEEAGQPVIKVIDAETDKVIRQIPQEEILRFQQRIEEMSGLIIQEQA